MTTKLDLPTRLPFDARHIIGFLLDRAIPGVEAGDAAAPDPWYARTLSLPSGPAAFRATWVGDRLCVDFELTAARDLAAAVDRVSRLFDLDADPATVDLAGHFPAAAIFPGTRLPGTVDPDEIVVRAIVGQQISVAAARTHLTRLTLAAGVPIASRFPLTHLFPTAERIADLLSGLPATASGLDPGRILRLPLRTLRTLSDTTTALADGTLAVTSERKPAEFSAGEKQRRLTSVARRTWDSGTGNDSHDLTARLLARPGIGPWTAAYIVLRTLNHPDTWLPGDTGLIHGAQALGLLDPSLPRPLQHARLQAAATHWQPWRSYAVMYLWRAARKNPADITPRKGTNGPSRLPTSTESSRRKQGDH